MEEQIVNYPESIPSIVYGILGLSITIATFLPALVYSYNKDLLKNLADKGMDKGWEPDKKVWQRVVSFIYSNDLLLTQSMIQVFFASLYGLLVFTSYVVHISSRSEIILFTFWALFGLGLHWSSFIASKKAITSEFDTPIFDSFTKREIWAHHNKAYMFWGLFSVLNLLITTACILIVFIEPYLNLWDIEQFVTIFFICFQSFVLITYAVSWIIPLVVYSPLQTEVNDYLKNGYKELFHKNGNDGCNSDEE